VALVRTLLARGLADRVHVVPARQSPLKAAAPRAGAAERLRLVELAFAGIAAVAVDARELDRSGPSYTVATLEELAAEHPQDTWRLVVGADTVADFARWREPERLLALARPLVVARGPVTLAPPLAERADVLADFDHPASATGIRRELAAGVLPGPDVLPSAVAEVITAAGLYGWPGPPSNA
jgi:nicotinate-nucleotide adenylyltransferase